MHKNKAFFSPPHFPWSFKESEYSSDEKNVNIMALSLWIRGCSVSLDCF